MERRRSRSRFSRWPSTHIPAGQREIGSPNSISSARQTSLASSKSLLILLAVATASLFLSKRASAATITLDHGTFKVEGWAPPRTPPAQGWASVFTVYAGRGDVPPLLGDYAIESSLLVFHPKFPIAPGVHYRAIFHPSGAPAVEQAFDGPPRATQPIARVEHIYPSAEVLPANVLRLYLYFSAPMSQGEADQRVHLLDARGQTLPGVFLPGSELWDPGLRRLTLTFDPGRIKRGLTSNRKMGTPIAPGQRYTLVIDRGWPDARGVAMVEGVRRNFTGAPALRTTPDPHQWKITPPQTGTRQPLIVDFPAPLNYALLQRMLRVSGPQGNVPGVIEVEHEEKRWRFIPQDLWPPGHYHLTIDTAIEDLAGNHIGQPFDIDVFDHVTEHITSTTTQLDFNLR